MELHLTLDSRRDLTGQLVHQIRAAIQSGRLRSGERMPPSRLLADQVGVARKTVTTVYERLVADGWLVSRVGDGTYVGADLAEQPRARAREPALPPQALRWRDADTPFLLPPDSGMPRYAFQPGLADPTRFPHAAWARCVRAALAEEPRHLSTLADPAGEAELRDAIARHVAYTRGVMSSIDMLMVTAGAQQGIDLAVRLLVAPGSVVAMEEPGYPMARALFRAAGARVVPVPVDDEGLVVDALPPDAALVYVTPSHQSPLGVSMSLARRRALLDWAARRETLIVEDDYDSEFRYGGHPVDALQTLDRHERVIYLGTFSKTMTASLRCGYLIAPPWLMPALRKIKHLVDWHTATLTQRALASFMREGHLLRHIRRSQQRHAQRRTRLLARLHGDLLPWLAPVPSHVGFHQAARLRVPLETEALLGLARRLDLALTPLDVFYATPPRYCAGLLFGFGAIDLLDIDPALDRLVTVLSELAPVPAHNDSLVM
jgi:GntR family transcriptional regulator/MocR family aminotransferase